MLAVRCSGKHWYPVGDRNSLYMFRRIEDVVATYANLIDYARILIAFVACSSAGLHAPWLTGSMIILSYLLDWVDGPVARATNQCSYLGANLDWYADILTSLAQSVWWATLDPHGAVLMLWPALFIEIGYMLIDTVCYSQARYPAIYSDSTGAKSPTTDGSTAGDFVPAVPQVKRQSISTVLGWSLRAGTHGSLYMYTDFYALIWFVFPVTTSSICIQWELGHQVSLSAAFGSGSLLLILCDLWLSIVWTVGVVLSFIFVITEASLVQLLFAHWSELRDLPKTLVCRYSDVERNIRGGCSVYHQVSSKEAATAPMSSEAIAKSIAPNVFQLPTGKPASLVKQNLTVEQVLEVLPQLCRTNRGDKQPEWYHLVKDVLLVNQSPSASGSVATPFEHVYIPLDADSKNDAEDGAVCVPPRLPSGAMLHYLAGSKLRLRPPSATSSSQKDNRFTLIAP